MNDHGETLETVVLNLILSNLSVSESTQRALHVFFQTKDFVFAWENVHPKTCLCLRPETTISTRFCHLHLTVQPSDDSANHLKKTITLTFAPHGSCNADEQKTSSRKPQLNSWYLSYSLKIMDAADSLLSHHWFLWGQSYHQVG